MAICFKIVYITPSNDVNNDGNVFVYRFIYFFERNHYVV